MPPPAPMHEPWARAADPQPAPALCRSTLNQKVFKKLGFQMQKEEMDGLCNCQTQAVERLLKTLQMKMAKCASTAPIVLRLRSLSRARTCTPPCCMQSRRSPPHPLPRLPRYGAKRAAAGGSPGEGDDNIAPSGGAPKATPRSVAAPGTRRSAGGGVESRMEQMGMQDGGVRELLAEKDLNIRELRETVDILEIKIQKLEQLVRLKDSKIATLQAKLQQQPPM